MGKIRTKAEIDAWAWSVEVTGNVRGRETTFVCRELSALEWDDVERSVGAKPAPPRVERPDGTKKPDDDDPEYQRASFAWLEAVATEGLRRGLGADFFDSEDAAQQTEWLKKNIHPSVRIMMGTRLRYPVIVTEEAVGAAESRLRPTDAATTPAAT